VCGLSTGAPNPIVKGKWLIVVNIGSEEGFVDCGLLMFESKKYSLDYHDKMNGDVFFDCVGSEPKGAKSIFLKIFFLIHMGLLVNGL